MCDCAEESERRRRDQLNARNSGAGGTVAGGAGRGAGSGSGAGVRGRPSGSADDGIGFFRLFFGGSAFLFSVLALLHKYLNIFGPLLEKYGPRQKKKYGGSAKSKYLDPNDPDPKRCDGLRIDPSKRRWPLDDKT